MMVLFTGTEKLRSECVKPKRRPPARAGSPPGCRPRSALTP